MLLTKLLLVIIRWRVFGGYIDTKWAAKTRYGSSYALLKTILFPSILYTPWASVSSAPPTARILLFATVSTARNYAQVTGAVICRIAVSMVDFFIVAHFNTPGTNSRATRIIASRPVFLWLFWALEFGILVGNSGSCPLPVAITVSSPKSAH